MTFLRKVMWLARRGRKDAELREELQFHLEEDAGERIGDGLTADEAAAAARREFGNLTLVQEDTRAAWTWTLVEQLAQDVRYAARTFRANKTFTALAIMSLALGIGANTAIFSFMDAMLLRALPVPDPQSLVTLAWHTRKQEMHGSNRHENSYDDPNGGYVGGIFSYPAFELLQRDTSVFTTVFGYQGAGDLHFASDGRAEIVNGEYVSGNYFSGLGLSAAAGRLLAPDDDRAGAPAVAVISYGLSKARFGEAWNGPGRSILLDNIPFTVVGVTRPEFFGADPNARPDVYVPLHANLLLQAGQKFFSAAERYGDPGYDWVSPMARLRPGVTAAQAQAALAPVYAEWKAANDAKRAKADLPTLVVRESSGGLDSLRRTYERPLYVLLGLVGLILAIACANIANLLLARAAARTREMAVRLSIGAGRARLIRQLLTESLLLAAVGGALGVAFAVWGIRVLTLLLLAGRGDVPFAPPIGVNWRVLGVVGALSGLTGVAFGLVPAIRSTRVDLTPALKLTDRPRLTGTRRLSTSRVLLVVQFAFTLVILVTAGLFLRTLSNLESIDVGFNREVLTFAVNARQAGQRDPGILAFYDRLQSEFTAIPAVTAVTVSESPLLGMGWSGSGVTLSNAEPPKNSLILPVGPRFFTTMQIPLLRGRELEARDGPGAPYVAVVNEAFARSYFGSADPIGRQILFKRYCATCDLEIVGVVANVRYGRLTEAPRPTVFLSLAQAIHGPIGEVTYALRTAGDPRAAERAVRDIVERADPRVPVIRMKTQRELIDGMINQQVTFAQLCSAFAILALAIACVGLYGTMSYGVARRTSEIGIRMALGARRAAVVWMVLREALSLAAIGLAISVPAALAGSKVVESFLFGMKRNDPLALTAAVLTLVTATLVAGYLPARNASRIDPMAALRHD